MGRVAGIAISLTSKCTLACAHCGEAHNHPPVDELTLDEIKNILTLCVNFGCRNVTFSGGEPLLRDDLEEILAYAGMHGISCGLLTNGSRLSLPVVRALKRTKALSFIRMSVEYPESALPQKRGYLFAHNTKLVLEKVAMCKRAGVVTGVNMTLLPDNLDYLIDLADACRGAGAAYFRAVPLFPAGNAAAVRLPAMFFSQCIEALFKLQKTYAGTTGKLYSSHSIIGRIGGLLSYGCGAGQTLFSIAADGTVHFCPMVSTHRPLSCREMALDRCIALLERRRAYLQRKISTKEGSLCKRCRYVEKCRGGCIAEWHTRGRPTGQPCCYKKTVQTILQDTKVDPEYQGIFEMMMQQTTMAELLHGKASCMRSLPLWTVRF